MNTLLKNKKLVEAVGTLLVLGAWMLDWGSVQHWSHLESALRDSLSSIQSGYTASHLDTVIQLEAAVTRATSGRVAVPEKSTENYAVAWESAEVRAAWFRRTGATIQMLRNISQVLGDTQARELIGKPATLGVLNDRLNRIEAEAQVALASPRGRAAGQIETQLGEISAMTVAAVNELMGAIRGASEWRSGVYRLIFLIGSVALLMGRGLDWWKERQTASM